MELLNVREKWNSSRGLKVTSCSLRPTPTIVQLPPRRTELHAIRIVAAAPTHSKAWSAPRPSVRERICLCNLGSLRTKCVAPAARASSSFSGDTSTAMIGFAPTSLAPMTADRPIPPSPMTKTDSPARTPAVLRTAPTPVNTAQPINAPSSSGTPWGRGTTEVSGSTTSSANAPTPMQWLSGVPSAKEPRLRVVTPSTTLHNHGSPAWQNQHCRQGAAQLSTTLSPTAKVVTSEPTSAIMPQASWPRTTGNCAATVPLTIDRALWHTPAATIRIRTSPDPTGASATSQTYGVPSSSWTTTALTIRSSSNSADPTGSDIQ